MSVYGKLYEETQHHIEEIGTMELGSDAHVKTVNCTASMIDRLNDHQKIELEDRKLDLEEKKLELEKAKLKSDKKGRLVLNIITSATTVATIGVHVWTVLSDRKFESEGFMHTSEAGRNSRKTLLSLVDRFRK